MNARARRVIDREPLDKRRADVAIVRPGGGILGIVALVQRIRARTSDGKFAVI
jgi:hypothetical protein